MRGDMSAHANVDLHTKFLARIMITIRQFPDSKVLTFLRHELREDIFRVYDLAPKLLTVMTNILVIY